MSITKPFIESSVPCCNCGGSFGIHHYKTIQCPVGGIESPIDRKQEWMSTTFLEKIIIDVRGGVAYCDDPRVEIIDHDNH